MSVPPLEAKTEAGARRTRRARVLLVVAAALVVLAAVFWRPLFFVGGGGFIAIGHGMQDLVSGFRSGDGDTPEEVLAGVLDANQKASFVRGTLPVVKRKPEVLVVMCIDPRLDARVVVGDTRDQYDVVRIPGSVLSEEAIEAIELGVKEHRVKVVMFTTHTECAMEAVAHSHDAEHFPALSQAVLKREEQYRALLARPLIAERIASGALIVKRFVIDTSNDRLLPAE
jgi:hypothetical protein